jgi:hypothetical protein
MYEFFTTFATFDYGMMMNMFCVHNKLLITLKFFVVIFAHVLVAVKYVHIRTVIVFDLFLLFMS